MNSLLFAIMSIVNFVAAAGIMLCMVDVCRVVQAYRDPWRSLVYILVAVGAAAELLAVRVMTLETLMAIVTINIVALVVCAKHLRRQLSRQSTRHNIHAHH